MSVFAYVSCDFRDDSLRPGERLCPAQAIGYNMARARKEARSQGWLLGVGKTRFDSGNDYCPQHKDALEVATKHGGDSGDE